MLTLRPENTAGVVRAVISGGLTQNLPLNISMPGRCFDTRPQRDRMRQFHQVGLNIWAQIIRWQMLKLLPVDDF